MSDLPPTSVTLPVDAAHPFGIPGEAVSADYEVPAQRARVMVDIRTAVSIVLVLAGVVLGLVAAAMVNLIALLAVSSIMCLTVGLVLAYEGD